MPVIDEEAEKIYGALSLFRKIYPVKGVPRYEGGPPYEGVTDFSYFAIGCKGTLGRIISGKAFYEGWKKLSEEDRLFYEAYYRGRSEMRYVPTLDAVNEQVQEWLSQGPGKVREVLADQDSRRREEFQKIGGEKAAGVSEEGVSLDAAKPTSDARMSYSYAPGGPLAKLAAGGPGEWELWDQMSEFHQFEEWKKHASSSHWQANSHGGGRGH